MTGGVFLLAAVTLVASAFFLSKRGLRYLQAFQQEGYDGSRFVDWYKRQGAFDRRGSIAVLTLAIIVSLLGYQSWGARLLELLAAIVLFAIALFELDPRESGKLPLKMTARATRIFTIYLAFVCISLTLTYFVSVALQAEVLGLLLLQIFMIQAAPFAIVLANRLLAPYEEYAQRTYLQEAQKILQEVDPFVIGITGSYGKTTTKNILGQILSGCVGSTFWPTKGINTPMGITRSIRENLKPHHHYAVIEMGAYRIGSIRRLCHLTPPKAAIVTAVGIMHLDRFEGQENIYQGKSELAQAVPEDGILVCNGDNPGARRMAGEFKKKTTLLYGIDCEADSVDCFADGIRTTEKGTAFTIHWQGLTYQALIPLFGRTAVSNVLGCFTMACSLGVSPEYVVALLASLEQIENRLYVDKQGPVTFLRDAYNSNPSGFAAALEVLQEYPGERRILMTPGMIELGEMQFEENRKIGVRAAEVCDEVLVVSPVNQEALLAGLSQQDGATNVHVCADRAEAFAKLAELQKNGDVILIENDLPDVLETREVF